MSKLIKYILLAIIVVCAVPSKQTNLTDIVKELNYSNITSTYYTNSSVKNVLDASVLKNGNAYLVQCDIKNCNKVKSKLNNIQGESVSFDATYYDYISLRKSLMNKIYIVEDVYDIKTCYGYNKKLTSSVKIDNNNINIQIAYNKGKIVIGSPVILGSF